MLFEPGYVWQDRTSNGKGMASDELILNGTFPANVLQVKPYATTLSYSRSHEEAKYGFFSTATVDSQSWGATSGYRDGPVPVEASFRQSHEEQLTSIKIRITDQTLLNLRARNEREKQNATATGLPVLANSIAPQKALAIIFRAKTFTIMHR